MMYRLAVPHLAVVALTITLAACGPDTSPIVPPPADPGYRSLHVQDEASLGVTATGMMAAIGCTPGQGRPDSNTVALPLLPSTIKLYRCPGVRPATLLATAKAIRAVTARNPVWASALDGGAGGSPYYTYDHTECVWQESTPPEYGTRINADGDFEIFVRVDAQPGMCAWVAIFKYVVPGDGGSSTTATPAGGSGGAGTPVALPIESVRDVIESFEPEALLSDTDTLPDCRLAQDHLGRRAWCLGRAPAAGDELDRVHAALQRMRAIGGECVALADALQSVVAAGRLRLTSDPGLSGWAPLYMGGDAPVVIHERYVTRWYSASQKASLDGLYVTLQFMLAHEIDHALGNDHIDGPRKLLTRHTLLCSDVASQEIPQ